MEITNKIAELFFFFFFHTELSYSHKEVITLLNVNKPPSFPVNQQASKWNNKKKVLRVFTYSVAHMSVLWGFLLNSYSRK